MLGAVFWVILRLARSTHDALERWRGSRLGALRLQQAEIVPPTGLGLAIERVIRAGRLVLILLAIHLYLTYVLGLFPWTRALSATLLEYVVTPIRMAAAAVVGYLPNLAFVVVIGVIFYWAIRLVGLFFHQIEHGRIVFPNFPAEWAAPTNKIARVLLIAFGLVVAFPYLPASDSPAFAGVSVFIGVLVSLASSSALSNMIAGVVLTYTGAFRLGDRVKVGDSFGDIIEASLLATRVRTIKNEDITIPNSVVLGSSVINYSREARTLGLILHTSVTIGYDAPWRTVHDLLIEAALATPGVLQEPPALRLADGPERLLRHLRDQCLYRLAARDDRHLRRAARQNPGYVLRRRRRDHVPALHVAPRRQRGRDSGIQPAAGLPRAGVPRGGRDREPGTVDAPVRRTRVEPSTRRSP